MSVFSQASARTTEPLRKAKSVCAEADNRGVCDLECEVLGTRVVRAGQHYKHGDECLNHSPHVV